jgi:hypothetical protein
VKPESPLKALARTKVKAMMRLAQKARPQQKPKPAAAAAVDDAVVVADVKVRPCA